MSQEQRQAWDHLDLDSKVLLMSALKLISVGTSSEDEDDEELSL